MFHKITLDLLAILLVFNLFFIIVLGTILCIIILNKFNAVFLMFETTAEGISKQHQDLQSSYFNSYSNQKDALVKIASNQKILQENIMSLKNNIANPNEVKEKKK